MKEGDKGYTRSVSGKKMFKDDLEIEVYGTLDELLAYVGYAYSKVSMEKVQRDLSKIIKDIHALIAEIGHPQGRITSTHVMWLEERIKEYDSYLKPINKFVLEMFSEKAAVVNLCRVVCRKAERRVVSLSRFIPVKREILAYLNRLSDFLFVLVRYILLVDDIKELSQENDEDLYNE